MINIVIIVVLNDNQTAHWACRFLLVMRSFLERIWCQCLARNKIKTYTLVQRVNKIWNGLRYWYPQEISLNVEGKYVVLVIYVVFYWNIYLAKIYNSTLLLAIFASFPCPVVLSDFHFFVLDFLHSPVKILSPSNEMPGGKVVKDMCANRGRHSYKDSTVQMGNVKEK